VYFAFQCIEECWGAGYWQLLKNLNTFKDQISKIFKDRGSSVTQL